MVNNCSAIKFAACVVATVATLLAAKADAQTRTWTSKSGNHTIEAKLLEIDGNEVKLLKTNGKTITVKKLELGQADRDYLAQQNTKSQKVELETLPDNKSETWKFVMRAASQGYAHGSKRIKPAKDGDRLLEMAQNDSGDLSILSRQLVLRQVMNDRLDKSQSLFGEKFETAVKVGQASTINSSIRQMDDEYFGGGVDYISEMESIMRDIGPMVQSGINQQVQSLRLSRKAWVVESVVASQIAKMQEASDPTESKGLTVKTSHYKSGKKPHSAYKLINRTETTIPWCVIVLHNDCDYTTPDSENFHNNFSNLLGEILVGGNQPDFTERTKALEAYSDIDKTTVFFVEDWKPKQAIKIVGTPALEFFNTADDIQITAYWTGCKQTLGVDVERYKRSLKKRFAPKKRR